MFSEKCHEMFGTANHSTRLKRSVSKTVFLQTTELFCRFGWTDSAPNLFPATKTQMFSQSLSSHTFCSCFEIVSTTNNVCKFWHNKLQHINTHAFCIWDDMFTQERNCCSPNKLFKCTETAPTLSIITSLKKNLCLF